MQIDTLNSILKRLIDSLGSVEVDQDFIDARDIRVKQFKANGRSIETRLKHADCTLLEHTLIKNEQVEKPENKWHDFCVQDSKIDVKCIESTWYSPKTDNIPWMLEGIKRGMLTHFGFYHMQRPNRPLQIGDKIFFEYIKVEDAMTVLNGLKISKFNGYYYGVK